MNSTDDTNATRRGSELSEGLCSALVAHNGRLKMMGRTELCAWLRANSSGDYRPAAEAADEIEHLAAAKDSHFAQAMANGAKAREYRDEADALRALLADVDANMRRAWADRSLSADAWPTELAQRVAQAVGAA
jgi:hypothetical protein